MVREILMVLLVTCCTLASQLLIKLSVRQLAERTPVPTGFDWLVAAMTSLPVISAIALQGFGFTVWVVVMSRLKLGAAFAISGGFFYLLAAAAGWYFYGEKLTAAQWGGVALVSAGVLLIALPGVVAK